ncbi:uncharacterized protein FA14DRAFT_187033 [Meira miltonrushii]|uniref:Uncharacterized protein n=1 Tax=Meira miltonrushii TaxID=1280837 RepID=A0A316VGV0_9BASI|nr:uncharacterized protein FA14DRAFT_187033 [Meira miltonrushii]PWN36877.1 hypothetical protein FA14DRAFT_187033 [Meira miltonrushii]
MASNPLLALLNFSGTTSPPASSNVNTQGNTQNAASISSPPPGVGNHAISPSPTGNSNASYAANSLLQSLLSPSGQAAGPSHSQYDQAPQSMENDRVTSPAASNGAAELLALLGGSPQGQPNVNNTNSNKALSNAPSPLASAKTSGKGSSSRVPSSTIFDQVNPFDLFNQPHQSNQTAKPEQPNQVTVDDRVTKKDTLNTNSTASPRKEDQFVFTEDRQFHASRQLASLRASNSFDDESTSGLTIKKNGKAVLNLLSQQPAGESSLYPAKLEMTAISLLKGPKCPTYYTQQGDNHTIQSRWPQQSIIAGANDIVCYLTGKSKVRIIDEKTGERAMIVSDDPIKSLFLNDQTAYERTEFKVGIVTGKSIKVWALTADFGRDEGGVKLIAHLEADDGQQFIHAFFSHATEYIEESIVAIQSSGDAAIFKMTDLQPSNQSKAKFSKVQRISVGKASTDGKLLVGLTQTCDGTLLASTYATGDSHNPLEVHLQALPDTSRSVTVKLPGLPDGLPLSDVSFTALASDGESTRSLIVGFNYNTVIAFVDLVTGEYRQLYHFDGKDHTQYNLAYWSHSSATLFIFNSLRSSLFTLRPFNKPAPLDKIDLYDEDVAKRFNVEVDESVGDGPKTIDRIQRKMSIWSFDDLHPAMKECAMPETWMSFALDDRYEWEGIRLAALYSGGIQTLVLPGEAVKQTALQDDSELGQEVTFGGDAAEVHVKTEADASNQIQSAPIATLDSASSQTKTAERAHDEAIDRKQMDETIANLRKNILSSASAEAARSAAEQATSTSSNVRSGIDAGGIDVGQLSKSIVERVVPAITAQVKNAVEADVQIALSQVLNQSLPNELHNAFLRPDINAYLTKTITNSIVPTVQKTAMDVVTRAMAPHFEEVISDLTAKVEGRIEQGMTSVRKDIVVEQSKALLESEAAMRDLTRQVGQLTSMMEGLGRQNAKLERALNDVREEQKVLSLNSIRPPTSAGTHHGRSSVTNLNPMSPNRSTASGINGQISSVMGSAPTPSTFASSFTQSNPAPQQDVEDTLLTALSNQSNDHDPTSLQSALTSLESRFGSAYAAIRSPEGALRISQAVNLAMIHRLIKTLQSNAIPEKIIPWIEACCSICDRSDANIGRVFEGIKREMLDNLFKAHHQLFTLTNRTPWWTRERLNEGILRYIS